MLIEEIDRLEADIWNERAAAIQAAGEHRSSQLLASTLRDRIAHAPCPASPSCSALPAASVVARKERDALADEPLEKAGRVGQLGQPRAALHVPVVDTEAAPRLEQLGAHPVGARAVRGELERPVEAPRRPRSSADDDVRLADVAPARVRSRRGAPRERRGPREWTPP